MSATGRQGAAEGLTLTVELTAEQLELVAARVAALLQPAAPDVTPLVDAQKVATALGVSRDTIYAHAERLGGRRIGDGTRPRWRFDLERARAAWSQRSAGEGSQPPESPVAPRV